MLGIGGNTTLFSRLVAFFLAASGCEGISPSSLPAELSRRTDGYRKKRKVYYYVCLHWGGWCIGEGLFQGPVHSHLPAIGADCRSGKFSTRSIFCYNFTDHATSARHDGIPAMPAIPPTELQQRSSVLLSTTPPQRVFGTYNDQGLIAEVQICFFELSTKWPSTTQRKAFRNAGCYYCSFPSPPAPIYHTHSYNPG